MIPVIVTFRGVNPSAALQAEIEDRARGLDEIEADALGCHVIVESIRLPGSECERTCVSARLVLSDRELDDASPLREAFCHQDAYAAGREALDALRRRIEGPAFPAAEDLVVSRAEEALGGRANMI